MSRGIPIRGMLVFVFLLSAAYGQQPHEEEPPLAPPQKQKEEGREKEGGIDIVFVLDDSGSMKYTDTEEFRKLAVKAFLDLTQDRGGDRIAIVRFAGWQESMDSGYLLFPFTKMPEDEKERQNVLGKMKKAITDNITAFGTTTDFNFAFGVALKEVLKGRDTKRPLWVILFTDGDMYIRKEPGRELPEVYKKELGSLPPYPATLKKLAVNIFDKKTLPGVAKIPNLYLTCVKLRDEKKKEKKNIVLDLIAQKLNTKILEGSRDELKTVFIEALSSLPKGLYRPGITRGFGHWKATLGPNESKEFALHLFQGAVSTKVVLFADDSRFSVKLLNEEGETVYPPEGVVVPGTGDEYRVLTLKGLPWGDYRLLVTNKTDRAMSIEQILYAEFSIALSLLVKELSPIDAGDIFSLSFQLKDTRDGSTITDRSLLEATDLLVSIGGREGIPQNFAQLTSSENPETAKIEASSDALSTGGDIVVTSYASLIPGTLFGGYAYQTEEVEGKVRIIAPIIEIEAPTKLFQSQDVEFKARILKGALDEKQKKDGIKLTLFEEKLNKEVELVFTPSSEGELTARASIDDVGVYRLKINTFDTGRVENADFAVTVEERRLEVFLVDERGNRLSVEEVRLECEEEEKARFKLGVKFTLSAGETATGTLLFSPKRSGDADILSVGAPVVGGKFNLKKDQTVEIPFSLTGKEGVPEYAGDLVIGVELKDKPKTRREESIRLKFKLKERPFPWWLVAAGAAALFIIILLLVLASRPKFEEQQLWFGVERRYILRDFGKRSFVGTEEAERSLQLFLKGSKKKPICYLRPLSETPIYVNNEQVQRLKMLSHGAQVVVYPPDGEPLKYRYWEREPSVEEYMKPAVLPGEGEEYFLIIEEE